MKEQQKPDGSLGVRFKARMLARRVSKIEGIHYVESYTPVVKLMSVRVLLSIVPIYDLDLH